MGSLGFSSFGLQGWTKDVMNPVSVIRHSDSWGGCLESQWVVPSKWLLQKAREEF